MRSLVCDVHACQGDVLRILSVGGDSPFLLAKILEGYRLCHPLVLTDSLESYLVFSYSLCTASNLCLPSAMFKFHPRAVFRLS